MRSQATNGPDHLHAVIYDLGPDISIQSKMRPTLGIVELVVLTTLGRSSHRFLFPCPWLELIPDIQVLVNAEAHERSAHDRLFQ